MPKNRNQSKILWHVIIQNLISLYRHKIMMTFLKSTQFSNISIFGTTTIYLRSKYKYWNKKYIFSKYFIKQNNIHYNIWISFTLFQNSMSTNMLSMLYIYIQKCILKIFLKTSGNKVHNFNMLCFFYFTWNKYHFYKGVFLNFCCLGQTLHCTTGL